MRYDNYFHKVNKDCLKKNSCYVNSLLTDNILDELKVRVTKGNIDIFFISKTKLDDNISEHRC